MTAAHLVALVTRGEQGIGNNITSQLEGIRLLVGSRDAARGQATVNEFHAEALSRREKLRPRESALDKIEHLSRCLWRERFLRVVLPLRVVMVQDGGRHVLKLLL
jgi:hypothetical protein